MKKKNPELSTRLLAWYDVHRRVLPWRAPAGKRADPYKVWLSEIMLQQTTVQAVAGYYRKFLKAWPDVTALADASRDDVLAAWAGLGYYARARNLHAAVQHVVREHDGVFPDDPVALRRLPGIGRYTAGAVASIAFGVDAAAVDTNIARVLARVFRVRGARGSAARAARLWRLAERVLPRGRAGDWNQAQMDQGATICVARRPRCMACPVASVCRSRVRQDPQ